MSDVFDIQGNITSQRASGATQWLVDNAPRIGAAKAEMQKADNMLRVVKSLIISASEAKTVGEREAEAYASPQYKDAINALFEATKTYETLRSYQSAGQAVIDMWRSINAAQKSSRV